MKQPLISLGNLKQFLSELKKFIKDYFDSRIDTEFSSESLNPLANSTVTNRMAKAQWSGYRTQLDAAIISGDIIPGYTVVNILDDDEDPWVLCPMEDIYALFGIKYA